MRPGFLKGLFMGGALGVVVGMAMAPSGGRLSRA